MLRSVKSVSALAVAATALLLAGCSGTTGTSSTSTPSAAPSASTGALACASSGAASQAVKVTDKGKGVEPGVTFEKGLTDSATQRTVVRAGSGTAATKGDQVTLAFVLYDGTTGKRIDAAGYGGKDYATFPVDTTQLLPGLVNALNCSKSGERFAAVIPPAEAFGSAGREDLGVAANESLVMVGDVTSVTTPTPTPTPTPLPSGSPTAATGAAKALPSGFPTVTLAANGQPTVKIPATDPPSTLKIAESKVGTGATVKSGDSVTVQYTGVLWRNGETFDSSWSRGEPATFATNQVVKGFGEALVGAKVGSQVVAIIPPADGYGASGQGDIKGTDTMVFVIDILNTQTL